MLPRFALLRCIVCMCECVVLRRCASPRSRPCARRAPLSVSLFRCAPLPAAPVVASLGAARASLTLRETVCVVLQRMYSEGVGPSLRSSPSGLQVTIFGAYGFIGRYLTQCLGA